MAAPGAPRGSCKKPRTRGRSNLFPGDLTFPPNGLASHARPTRRAQETAAAGAPSAPRSNRRSHPRAPRRSSRRLQSRSPPRACQIDSRRSRSFRRPAREMRHAQHERSRQVAAARWAGPVNKPHALYVGRTAAHNPPPKPSSMPCPNGPAGDWRFLQAGDADSRAR
jgi:hypothetical protein